MMTPIARPSAERTVVCQTMVRRPRCSGRHSPMTVVPSGAAVSTHLPPRHGRANVIGVTGYPGAGKSTLIASLIAAYRRLGMTVGVLAVDISSKITGGALLGDRIRMQDWAADAGVYIRSMATRGHVGGVARATGEAVKVLEAAGYDVVLIETIGIP